MNEMELYFYRQNLTWKLGLYVMIGIVILILGVILYDICSDIYWKIYDYKKERRNKR